MKVSNKFFRMERHTGISLLIAVFVGIIFSVLFAQTKLLDGLETGSIDFRFFLRDPSESSQEIMNKVEIQKVNPRVNQNIIVLGVDEASMAEIGPWPWPWGIHADMIKSLNLSQKPPKSILFDIFFIDHKKLFSEDAAAVLQENLSDDNLKKIFRYNKINEDRLSDEIARSKNVYLDYPFFAERMKANIPDYKERLLNLDRISWPVPVNDTNLPWVQDVSPPLYNIAKGSQGIGFANIRYERGQNVNRMMPLVVKYNGKYYPNVTLILSMDYYDIKAKDVEIKLGDAIYLKNIPKILVPVINSASFPELKIQEKKNLNTSHLLEYTVSGISKDDTFAKAIGNPNFLTRIQFRVQVQDKISINDFDIFLVHRDKPDDEGQKVTSIKKFIVDKKKEVGFGQGALIIFEPKENGKILEITNNLGGPLSGRRTKTDIMEIPNDERVIKIPVDDEGFMLVNFVGGQQSFASHSYQMFVPKPGLSLKQREKHFQTYREFDSFERKVVMVAIYKALGLVDVHKSPYGPMFGIEHHANALNTVLNQDFISQFSLVQNLAIILFISLILGFLLPRISMISNAIISLTGILAYFIIAQAVFNTQSVIFAVATPVIQIMITFSAITVFRVMTEEEKSKYIKSTFSKFVSKEVVNELLSDPERLQLGGEDREITIFFSDIRGFTTISEALTPQELVLLLNEYLSDMTELIIRDKGTLDKYMGDAIMAFWGAPLPMADHAIRACICSVEMFERLKVLQEKWISEGRPPINIGIGLNTGNATVGNMGSANRMDYTCMGDTINLGSRLEGINKVYGTNIIMSEYTYEKVKDQVYARELDLIKVKGKTKPVYIYELVGIR